MKELSNILQIKILLKPSSHDKVFKYYEDNGFCIEGLNMVHYPAEVDDESSIKKTVVSKGGKRKTLKKYITKLNFYTRVPKEKYENIFKGAYERPEKYVPKNKTRKVKKIYE